VQSELREVEHGEAETEGCDGRRRPAPGGEPGSEEAKDAHVFYEAAVRLAVAGRTNFPVAVPDYIANA
jgi:hypothetical protein